MLISLHRSLLLAVTLTAVAFVPIWQVAADIARQMDDSSSPHSHININIDDETHHEDTSSEGGIRGLRKKEKKNSMSRSKSHKSAKRPKAKKKNVFNDGTFVGNDVDNFCNTQEQRDVCIDLDAEYGRVCTSSVCTLEEGQLNCDTLKKEPPLSTCPTYNPLNPEGGTCVDGVCVGKCSEETNNCKDDRSCTTNVCIVKDGQPFCIPIPIEDGTRCPTGNPCKIGTCSDGTCRIQNHDEGSQCKPFSECVPSGNCINGECTGSIIAPECQSIGSEAPVVKSITFINNCPEAIMVDGWSDQGMISSGGTFNPSMPMIPTITLEGNRIDFWYNNFFREKTYSFIEITLIDEGNFGIDSRLGPIGNSDYDGFAIPSMFKAMKADGSPACVDSGIKTTYKYPNKFYSDFKCPYRIDPDLENKDGNSLCKSNDYTQPNSILEDNSWGWNGGSSWTPKFVNTPGYPVTNMYCKDTCMGGLSLTVGALNYCYTDQIDVVNITFCPSE